MGIEFYSIYFNLIFRGEKMKKIVAITGSFNPVSKAHYKLLADGVERVNADEGVFICTNDKYLTKKALLKVKDPTNFILSEKQRGEMLNSLSLENPKLNFWGAEIGGADPKSYRTLVKLMKDKKKQYPGEEIKLYFLFGADKLKGVSHWNDADEMFDMCEFLVYARKFDMESVIKKDPYLSAHREKIHLLTVENDDLEEVSSTEIRRRFFAGEDYRDLMNEGPYNYMQSISPLDFEKPSNEDIIKAQILYGGHFGKNGARMSVYKANKELFQNWPTTFLGTPDAHRVAKSYKNEFKVNAPKLDVPTTYGCYNADCIDVAKDLIDSGYNPAILNLASRTSPGGGYHKGTSAQEESLCQASTLSQSLYQFGDPKYKHIRESGVTPVSGVYPMDINFGGVYSPSVTFFRHNIDNYFALRDTQFSCPVITVASLSNREKNEYTNDERIYFQDNGYLTEDGKEIEKNKIRTIFRIALDNGHDSIVLGAFGCGVYHLCCDEVASLFKDILNEDEFNNRFKRIVFAIYEGKPTSRKPDKGENGKFKPFYDLFK